MGSSFTCKLNPCCGDMLNCNPPPQYSDRYADKPASPPVNAAAAVDGARRILADMASMRWGCSGRSMEYVNDWFNERAREALAALASQNAVEGEAVASPCGIPSPSYHDCPNMKEVGGGMEGERYRCAVCGKGYFLDYEDMK